MQQIIINDLKVKCLKGEIRTQKPSCERNLEMVRAQIALKLNAFEHVATAFIN